jgi:multimeric flavodoxin WrbA
MRVLGISGSPRLHGNSELLLAEFLRGAKENGAEVKIIRLNNLKIAPCQHCDDCLKAGICRVKDDMQQIYSELEQADVIVVASPVQFMGPTAQLKAMIDRTQSLWAKKYVLKISPLNPVKKRRGFFISVAGTKIKGMFEPSLAIVKTWFHVIGVDYAGEIILSGVDEKGAILKHPEAMQKAFEIGQKLAASEN